jgi:hypothetical protein
VGYILAAALIDNLNKKREKEKDIILAVFLLSIFGESFLDGICFEIWTKQKEKMNVSDGSFLLYCNCSFHPWMY